MPYLTNPHFYSEVFLAINLKNEFQGLLKTLKNNIRFKRKKTFPLKGEPLIFPANILPVSFSFFLIALINQWEILLSLLLRNTFAMTVGGIEFFWYFIMDFLCYSK